MIDIRMKQEDLDRVILAMRNIEKSEESVLKTALNNTATRVRNRLVKRASKVYAGTAPAGILGRSKIIKASVSKVKATIFFKSKQPGIEAHKVSMFFRSRTTFFNGKRVKFPIYATQFAKSEMKLLEGYSMAFCVRFKSGKIAIVSRNADKKLKRLMGSSDRSMVGNEKVYGAEEEKIADILHEQVEKCLNKALGGK
ncbi:MAG: hypothetical protein HFG49_08370 [Lachnospiraceae bacterium]|jgi:hypothetical protein|nr:hypothetical protein [Lachnospiraceae bacterium]